jgi:hypothetical protein
VLRAPWRDRGTQPPRRPQHDYQVDAIGQHGRHDVAAADAAPGELSRDGGRALIDLGVRELLAGVAQAQPAGVGRGTAPTAQNRIRQGRIGGVRGLYRPQPGV